MTFTPLGDIAVVVTLGEGVNDAVGARVRALVAELEHAGRAGIVDIVPAYATVAVFYDPTVFIPRGDATPYDEVCLLITDLAAKLEHSWPELVKLGLGRSALSESVAETEVPVCYGGDFGPDLGAVAVHCGLPPAQVIERHRGADYVVRAVGFSPGFPYLGGLPEELHTPRRPTPRTTVPAGSVGIGWAQTGIYPLASPGGWQLIGRTPLVLFDPTREPPALLHVGDRVSFKAITPEEFAAWK